ncbi:uncharacterized protein LOC106093311 [Stomoxys calcitrans]|uniref:uncharacterized protein LOC106093311 n=1 Tax=Stomoxys calcitrans TaxID=35570 RepID=UPI0027E36A2C|nr:uncharacterized protein LOC106093311 [Stomoxys calcitrans]
MPARSIQKKDSVNYALFLHREELRKRRASASRVSRTKLLLTHELISKTLKNIDKCSPMDLLILGRETIFKKNLLRQMTHERQHQQSKYRGQQEQQRQLMQHENRRPLQRTSSSLGKQQHWYNNGRKRSLKF